MAKYKTLAVMFYIIALVFNKQELAFSIAIATLVLIN